MFRKQRRDAPPGFFRCEAAGLAWLAAARAVPVVRVLAVGDDHLDLERLTAVSPTRDAARAFGARLARVHAAGARAFGAPPDGWSGDGFFGPLEAPVTLRSGDYATWGRFLAECRIAPLAQSLATSSDHDLLRALDELAAELAAGRWDDDEPPARLHGDLWSGNVVWTAAGATLIDPAAHGGHRETDLAMLALFGFPHLDAVLSSYDDELPLRAGWRGRVPLHQVYPVGVHALLFGGHYHEQLASLLQRLVGR